MTCTCHIAEVSGTTSHYYSDYTDYSNEICDKLKASQTFKKYSFSSYFVFSIFLFKRALFPEYILAQQKNTRTPRMHLFLVVFFSKKLPIVCMSVRPSVSMSFCGNLISNRPIDPKIGLNVGYGVVHVRNA